MEEQINNCWKKVFDYFQLTHSDTKRVWENTSDITSVINWLGYIGINRILFPGGGWEDFQRCERSHEDDAISIISKGCREQIIKAKKLTLNILSWENPEWNYFILETGDDSTAIYGSDKYAEDLTLVDGNKYEPFTDEVEDEYPEQNARLVMRHFRGKAIITVCGTPIDRSQMDVNIERIPYNEFTEGEFRYVIEQAMKKRFNLKYVHEGITEIKEEYKELQNTAR